MPKNRVIPGDRELQRMVERGLTHQQIADVVSQEIGQPIARSSISATLSRAGMTDRIRYDETIPWTPIKIKHNMHYALMMLRLLARRNAEKELMPEQELRLDSWLARLEENKAVVVYVPTSEAGFHYVERIESDGKSLASLRVPNGAADVGS